MYTTIPECFNLLLQLTLLLHDREQGLPAGSIQQFNRTGPDTHTHNIPPDSPVCTVQSQYETRQYAENIHIQPVR